MKLCINTVSLAPKLILEGIPLITKNKVDVPTQALVPHCAVERDVREVKIHTLDHVHIHAHGRPTYYVLSMITRFLDFSCISRLSMVSTNYIIVPVIETVLTMGDDVMLGDCSCVIIARIVRLTILYY